MNIKLRFKNKAVLAAMIGAVIAFIYQMLAIFGVTPAIAESTITELVGIIINILVALGIVVDPSTAGIKDTAQVMTYTEPRREV